MSCGKIKSLYNRYINSNFYSAYAKYSRRFFVFIFLKKICDQALFCLLFEVILFPIAFIYSKIYLLLSKTNKDNSPELWAVCCIKNEERFLVEWVEYYKMIGFDKIVFYSCSNDNSKHILEKYIKDGFVKYYKNGKRRQTNAYNDSLNKFSKKNRYIAYVDIDEFLKSSNTNLKDEIIAIFQKFQNKKIGNLCISWLFFGSSGVISNNYSLVTQTFLMRAKTDDCINFGVKSVVDSSKVLSFINPHVPILLNGYRSFNCDGREIVNLWCIDNLSTSNITNNHYFVKSKEDFFNKINRGTGSGKGKRLSSDFVNYDKNDVFDSFMLRYKDVLTDLTKK